MGTSSWVVVRAWYLVVLVGIARAVQDALARRDGVSAVIGPATNPTAQAFGAVLSRTGDAARFVLFLESDPLGSQAVRQVEALRADLDRILVRAGLEGADTGIAGDTALVQETIEAPPPTRRTRPDPTTLHACRPRPAVPPT